MRVGVNGRFLVAPITGVQRFGREVTRRLRERSETVLLVPKGVTPSEEEVGPGPIVSGRMRGVAWEQIEMPRLARRAGASVILNPANSAPWWGGPHVVVLHDLAPLSEGSDFRCAYRLWVRVGHLGAARRAAAVATVSSWSAGALAGALRRPRESITVVAQGADPFDGPPSPQSVAAARREHGLQGPYFLAMVGGDPRKGLPFLHRLWGSWSDDPKPTLVVVGRARGGVHRSRFVPTPPRVRHLGSVSDDALRALLGGAVALLHPSRSEGFGRPPLEAMASGTPAVVAPYGPAFEVLGDAAEVVPMNVEAWRLALWRLLLEDPGERVRRVEMGCRRAAMHRWEDGVEALVALCERVGEGA